MFGQGKVVHPGFSTLQGFAKKTKPCTTFPCSKPLQFYQLQPLNKRCTPAQSARAAVAAAAHPWGHCGLHLVLPPRRQLSVASHAAVQVQGRSMGGEWWSRGAGALAQHLAHTPSQHHLRCKHGSQARLAASTPGCASRARCPPALPPCAGVYFERIIRLLPQAPPRLRSAAMPDCMGSRRSPHFNGASHNQVQLIGRVASRHNIDALLEQLQAA